MAWFLWKRGKTFLSIKTLVLINLCRDAECLGEILGARRAVELAIEKNLSSLTIFHDYQGISSWAKGEWKCNKEKTKEYHDFMQNAEKKIRLEFFKVPAHRGIYFNEIADALAKEAVTAR